MLTSDRRRSRTADKLDHGSHDTTAIARGDLYRCCARTQCDTRSLFDFVPSNGCDDEAAPPDGESPSPQTAPDPASHATFGKTLGATRDGIEAVFASGERAKARNIINAIRTPQLLEQEQRVASNEERRTIVRFAGFGPVALSIFHDPVSGRYKDASWYALGEELRSLLTAEEYESANRTTFNAFYTSPIMSMEGKRLSQRKLGLLSADMCCDYGRAPGEIAEADRQKQDWQRQPRTAALPGWSGAAESSHDRLVGATDDAPADSIKLQAGYDCKVRADDGRDKPANDRDHDWLLGLLGVGIRNSRKRRNSRLDGANPGMKANRLNRLNSANSRTGRQ